MHILNSEKYIKLKNSKNIKNAKTKKNNLQKKLINKYKCVKCKMDKKKCVCKKIEEIDNIIMAWRFSMCITCAWQCKGESFDDLFESSNYCHEQRHRIIHKLYHNCSPKTGVDRADADGQIGHVSSQ